MPSVPPVPPDPDHEIELHQPPRIGRGLPEIEPPRVVGIDLYGALLADAKSHHTRRARAYDVSVLAQYLDLTDPSRALALLFSGTAGQANALALGFRSHLIELGRASQTINRYLTTLRRASKLARRFELVAWTLDVDFLRREAYRDTSGPGDDGWRKILAVAEDRAAGGSTMGLRDLAMIRLLHDSGLRKGEMMALDLADVDVPGLRVAVVGKGKRDRAWLTINGPTSRALAGWLASRGTTPGPLFNRGVGSTGAGVAGGRLADRTVNRIVDGLAREAGLEQGCRPHGLRHAGATRLLDLTGGDIRAVQRWTRHANVNTVIIYDDNRRDLAGELARKLGEDD
jgi:integrase/recombinase XerC